jgi:hypothetical protein
MVRARIGSPVDRKGGLAKVVQVNPFGGIFTLALLRGRNAMRWQVAREIEIFACKGG